ncbi:MAG: hypothetical protein ACFFDW_05205 [Candidatus Thorarchaeota archaeon]
MSDYTIKHYQQGFEEEQAKIGTEIAKRYAAPHQTPANILKERYSQEGFDPETRLYAFKGDKMVGFLTSRILDIEEDGIKKANLTPPQVLYEHDKIASKMLLDKALEVLKKKGVQKVISQFGARASKDEEQAKKWGFNVVATNYYVYELVFSKIDTKIPIDKVVDFNYDKHLQGACKILASETGQTEEWAKGIFDRWQQNPDPNRGTFIIEEKGEIKAYTSIFVNNIVPNQGGLFGIWAANQNYMKQLLSKIAQFSKEKNINKITLGFTEETDIKQDKYKPIPYKLIATGTTFEKDL